MVYLWLLIALCAVIVIFRIRSMVIRKQKCLTFIEKYNRGSAREIMNSIMAHRRTLPPELVTALIWSESCFHPRAVGDDGEGLGLGQLNPAATDELEDYYFIEVDRGRLFEIDYNVCMTCLFLNRAKIAAKSFQVDLYLYYRALLAYKDWLTWNNRSYQKADRPWECYNTLRYGYQKYGRKVGEVRSAE